MESKIYAYSHDDYRSISNIHAYHPNAGHEEDPEHRVVAELEEVCLMLLLRIRVVDPLILKCLYIDYEVSVG